LNRNESGRFGALKSDSTHHFFRDEDDVSGNQNNCYWPLHSESIARCKHHMQEKLVTEYGTALTNILPILFLYLNTATVTTGTFEP
jgi:hypothetical protein